MITRGLFIERSDRFFVQEYLFWTNEYLRQLAQTTAGREAVLMSLAQDDMPDNVRVLEEVESRALDLRNRLKARVREVVGGEPQPVAPDDRPSEDY